MPDASDFDRNDNANVAGLPRDWRGAFAALPLETPDANGWQRVQSRLPVAVPTRTRWPLWLAIAASLALAVSIPLRMQPETVAIAAADVAPSSGSTLPLAPAPNRDSSALADTAPPPSATLPADATAATIPQARIAARHTNTAPSQRPIRTAAQPADSTRLATANTPAAADLEPLYAQSAQLEGLLTLARDDRVSSGTIAALTDELEAQVAGIDAALIQPDLSSQRRSELWGERVDSLRQLVGVEATQRLLAARGQQYDAALVSID